MEIFCFEDEVLTAITSRGCFIRQKSNARERRQVDIRYCNSISRCGDGGGNPNCAIFKSSFFVEGQRLLACCGKVPSGKRHMCEMKPYPGGEEDSRGQS